MEMRRDLERIAQCVNDAVDDLPPDFDRGEKVMQGADGTPTSGIDKIAEDIILSYVDDHDLPLNILSEEVGYIDRGAERTLVVDPIDGTNNSVMGIPYYSVSLAVGSGTMSDTTMGLVRNLVTGTTYFSEKGKGATRDGVPIHVREFDPPNSLFLIYMGRWASMDTMKVAKRVERARSLGCASLEMCLVADGTVDGYYMNCERYDKSIRVVDIAASALILGESGGELLSLDGERLDMPYDLDVRDNFAALGDLRSREVILSE
jgi:fructose-1,6-bisphosphatase/inositol monophosphatase family enzyme